MQDLNLRQSSKIILPLNYQALLANSFIFKNKQRCCSTSAEAFNLIDGVKSTQRPSESLFIIERVKGIEPSSEDWKSPTLTVVLYPQNNT